MIMFSLQKNPISGRINYFTPFPETKAYRVFPKGIVVYDNFGK